MQKLDPKTPVKKQVSAFLMKENFKILLPPPGVLRPPSGMPVATC
jgi:hypothetical protein